VHRWTTFRMFRLETLGYNHVSVICKNISAIYVNDLCHDQEWWSDIKFSKRWNCIEDVSTNDKLYRWMFFFSLILIKSELCSRKLQQWLSVMNIESDYWNLRISMIVSESLVKAKHQGNVRKRMSWESWQYLQMYMYTVSTVGLMQTFTHYIISLSI